jgi:class 3 adenylate cyclase
MDKEQLEKAIAALETQRAVLGDAVIETSLTALRMQLEELEAVGKSEQRKLATILFMDTVGSTRITHSLDPEVNLKIMGEALRLLSEPIEEHGGRVLKTMGDGLMAVFGVPTAHENDPDRAINAALRMLIVARRYATELKEQWQIPDYQVRLGISTGLIAISGSQGREELSGTTINLAARLEVAADPGTILISHGTYQHVRGAFDLQILNPMTVKGFPDPVPVYRVLAAKPHAFHSRRRGVEGVETRMVGRDRELGALRDAYRTVIEEGEHHAVTVIGEAGIGKSRLLYEFENWVDLQLGSEKNLFRARAQPERRILPYAFLRDLFAFRFNIQDDDPAAVAREKIEAGFGQELRSDELQAEYKNGPALHVEIRAHFIGHLLGYDFHKSRHLAGILSDPQRLRDRALSYLEDYFRIVSASGPILLLLEDLHWADDSSLDVLLDLSLKMRSHPFLVVSATRPELFERRPNWYKGLTFHLRLDLQPLSDRESQSLAANVLQEAGNVPAVLLDLIVSNADGNPFYVEELVKMLVQQGMIIKGDKRWRIRAERLAELHVPPTLSGLLQARLDGLSGQERAALQQASIVGRNFWDDVLMFLSRQLNEDQRDESFKETLVALQEKEIVFRREVSIFAGAIEYFFKHALFRQVAYESVLIKARRTYHSLVAEWLIEQSRERSGELIGLVAYHLEHAGRLEEALVYLRQAARQAAQLFAMVEALRFFDL